MFDDRRNKLAELESELVAYLDGETDPDTTRRLEEWLATDEEARARLRELERTWDALDELPRAHVGANFTCSTVEMLAVSEAQAAQSTRRRAGRDERWFWILATASALAAGSLAFAVGERRAERENDLLLENLPAIENLDAYRQAEDISLLRSLKAEGIFETHDDEQSSK